MLDRTLGFQIYTRIKRLIGWRNFWNPVTQAEIVKMGSLSCFLKMERLKLVSDRQRTANRKIKRNYSKQHP